MKLKFAALPLAAVTAALGWASPAEAQNSICDQLTIENCPSRFQNQCETDDDFLKANARGCVLAMADGNFDEGYCSSEEAASCKAKASCADQASPIDKFFCEQDMLSCERNIPALVGQYSNVLTGLDNSLAEYNQLISLDLGNVQSIETLCTYEISTLSELQTKAEQQLNSFKSSESSIGQLDQCSNTMQEFLDAGEPDGIPAELWDQIQKVLQDGMVEINQQQGAIQTQIEALESAPKKLGALQTTYGIICPKK